MQVQKRDGSLQAVQFDKITERIRMHSNNLQIDPIIVAKEIISRLTDKITTEQLDKLTCDYCASLALENSDYLLLASRLAISNHHKKTQYTFKEAIELLSNNIDKLGVKCPLISQEILNDYNETIEDMIDYNRDYNLDFFGFKTLERAYLLRLQGGKIIERPQHLWMRVALGIHGKDYEKVKETFNYLSKGYFTHATPTLFHAGTPRPQMSSCFLLGTEDSVDGIYDNIKHCAQISKWAGGIGVHVSNIRGKNAYIRKTGGKANGIIPMLKVYNDTARFINQSGKRNGSFAMYLEPWHADIFEFLNAKKPHGSEEERARDLFYALWIPDLFMTRVKNGGRWSLMCPDECRGLTDCYGDEFEKLYIKYENAKKYKKQIPAMELWNKILESQIQTGTPYMLYKDSCNRKSNQNNLGVIKSSNLCAEIIEYSNAKEHAVCNLASIALPKFLNYKSLDDVEIIIYTKSNCKFCKMTKKYLSQFNLKSYKEIVYDNEDVRKIFYTKLGTEYDTTIGTMPQIIKNGILIGGFEDLIEYMRPEFDFEKLHDISQIVTCNLNKIIDKNFYPTPESKSSNMKHRPIGIGIQGFADLLQQMYLPFNHEDTKLLNSKIFETIYHGALTASLALAKVNGAYSSWKGCPLSKGKFQFDLWDGETQLTLDWNVLRKDIMEYGVYNSLLLAAMPTASTAQILGNNESFEPYTSNIYIRRVLAGEYTIINKQLLNDLKQFGLWNKELKEKILYLRGSIQNISEIPKIFKDIYKTAWELPQKLMIQLSADRGRFIDQSQSFNIFVNNINNALLTKIHFYGWVKGLKTGSYYIRSRSALQSQRFAMDPKKEREICEMCSG